MAMIRPRVLAIDLSGNETEVLIQTFADRILVLVTQFGKVGNIIQASLPATTPVPPLSPNSLPEPSPGIQLTPLLGDAPSEHLRILHALYASQIATIVWAFEGDTGLRRNVAVGIALKSEAGSGQRSGLTSSERTVFNGVMDTVIQLLRQL